MIAQLEGKLAGSDSESCVIMVGGIGWLVHASARTLAGLGAIGDLVTLFTRMQVSENDMRLIGFASASERDWYSLLIGVQGVGSKVALAILSALTPQELALAMSQADMAMVARAQGVGPKLARRIVNELKDKLGGITLAQPGTEGSASTIAGHSASAQLRYAVSALNNLGFKPYEAERAVSVAAEELGDQAELDALVRLALKKAVR